ncbi:MAG: phosphotransferase, partial [Epsilonproteobacteria bacterium]|nr:phosphotransferase [Campylobacterota bacterium]
SLRNYYRVIFEKKSFVVMDATKLKSSLLPFIDVASKLLEVEVSVPQIIKEDTLNGYLLLEDFGDTLLANHLDENSFARLYTQALDEIIKMQKADTSSLELYDREFLIFEMNLMKDWLFDKYLSLELSIAQEEILEKSLAFIADEVLSQPQGVMVHRDFHSRNLMLVGEKIGVIDFQDAKVGAITYDLVSLLKDVYVYFEPQKIDELALLFRDKKALEVDDKTFIRWFDMMGLQRHIKILGIFARLHLRDGKSGYLKDLPLTYQYVLEAMTKYEELSPLKRLFDELDLKMRLIS